MSLNPEQSEEPTLVEEPDALQPESLPGQTKRSESRRQREAEGRQLARDLDPFDDLRSAFTRLGFERGEYGGIPVPIQGCEVEISEKFPTMRKSFVEINRIIMDRGDESDTPGKYDEWEVSNSFYSHKKRCTIHVARPPGGKFRALVTPRFDSRDMMIQTLAASEVWGVDQEQAALHTLSGMLKHRHFKNYLLSGMFMEKSKRSNIIYVFRRLRPTIALGAIRDETSNDPCTILAGLCMHPIAYYKGSWAGAMCPTDDIIAHLSLMRGDEHMFWKRCNQHPPHLPECGL